MKFNCNYDKLTEVLSNCSQVVEDGMSSEELKNVIFRFTKSDASSKVEVIGINRLITYKQDIAPEYVSLELDANEVDEFGMLHIQIKSKSLNGFLGTFKSMRRTRADEVVLENKGEGKILCSVLEKDIETEKAFVSHYTFENVPIQAGIRNKLKLAKPTDNITEFESVKILFHLQTLSGVLDQGKGANMFNYIMFGEDHVVALSTTFASVMQNIVKDGGIFKDIKLAYKAVSFLDKLLTGTDSVRIARTDTHLFVQTDSGEAFVTYETKLAVYSHYIELFKRDSGISLDRLYLKDILKRLSLDNDNVELTIKADEGILEVKNTRFSQNIPLMSDKNMSGYGAVKFKIMPDSITKAILGSDAEFGSNLFVYYCPHEDKKANIVFSDETDTWFTVLRVNTMKG